MTAAQKHAQANFKKAIAYRKKTGCTLKEAFAHVKGSVSGLDKVVKKGNKTTVKYTKKAKKKAAPKKKITQGVLFGVKKKAAKKSVAKSTHKDTKSHNVNIRVVSGVTDHYVKELNNTIKVLNEKEKLYQFHKLMSTNKERKIDLRKNDKQNMQILKSQIVNLKKHLTQIKKHIK